MGHLRHFVHFYHHLFPHCLPIIVRDRQKVAGQWLVSNDVESIGDGMRRQEGMYPRREVSLYTVTKLHSITGQECAIMYNITQPPFRPSHSSWCQPRGDTIFGGKFLLLCVSVY